MAKRKTIEVKRLVDEVNRINRESTFSPEHREGINLFLENILHETGNYEGFNHLYERDVPAGEKPGIIFDESGEHNHVFPDDTRKVYFF